MAKRPIEGLRVGSGKYTKLAPAGDTTRCFWKPNPSTNLNTDQQITFGMTVGEGELVR